MELTEFDVRLCYAPNRVQRYIKKIIYANYLLKKMYNLWFFVCE